MNFVGRFYTSTSKLKPHAYESCYDKLNSEKIKHVDSYQQKARSVALHSVTSSRPLSWPSGGLLICWLAFQTGHSCPCIPPSNYHRSVAITTARTNVSFMQVGFMHVAKEHLHCTLRCTFCSAGSSGAHVWSPWTRMFQS
jgi:hypothetical protein